MSIPLPVRIRLLLLYLIMAMHTGECVGDTPVCISTLEGEKLWVRPLPETYQVLQLHNLVQGQSHLRLNSLL